MLKEEFTQFVFQPCRLAKATGGARGGSTALATENMVLLVVGDG